MKRLFDFICSLFGIIVLIPVFIIVAILVKRSSPGPVLFVQSRVGRHGSIFKMIKFRSMKISQNSNSTTSFLGDKRVTQIGVFLRRYKLDELPELFNVLKGQMSLVGPRPDVAGYADKLTGKERNILEMRPGITGPASLKYIDEEKILSLKDNRERYNNKVIYPDKVRINLDYYYNNNIWIDIKIIFATIFRTSY